MNLLVISTISCILEYIAPVVIKYITSLLYSGKESELTLRNDLINLKQEMAGISMVDQFSKYAKLQRKYNQVESTLKGQVNERLSSKMKVQLAITYAFRILNGIFILVLLYLYKNEPVIILPEGALWPLQSLLSWPSHHENAISLVMWLAITRLALSTCKNINRP